MLLPTIIAGLEIVLGFVVGLKNTKSNINRSFFAMCLSMGIWSFLVGILLSDIQLSKDVMRLVANANLFIGVIITYSILIFSLYFPQTKYPLRKIQIIWIALPLVTIFIALFFTNTIITDVNPNVVIAKRIEFGEIGNFLYSLVFLLNIVIAIFNYIKKLKKSSGINRHQLIYVGIGLFFTAFLGSAIYVVFPLFKKMQYLSISYIVLIPFLVMSAYTILKYRLLDIEIVIRRTSLYLLVVGFITGVYAFVIILPYGLLGQSGSINSFLVMILAAIIITLTIQPLRNWLDNVTDRIFFHKKYNYEEILERVSKQLSSIVKITDAYDAVLDPCQIALHLKSAAIYMREKGGENYYTCQRKRGEIPDSFPSEIPDINPVIVYLSKIKTYLDPGEFKHQYGHLYADGEIKDKEKSQIQYEMDHTFDVALFVPLLLKNNMIGFMLLGEKLSGDQFTNRDLSLLETIASQLVTAMDNIRLYEQMLNNERLTIIGTMSASIAHEIRNPLASIKTFIQMLKDRYNKPEFMEKFNNIVPAEIERISGITTDLLNFSKPSAPRLEIVDISNLVDRIVALLAAKIRKRQIKLEKKLTNNLMIHADSQQLFQVFLNIMLNAMQASPPKSTITIFSHIRQVKHSVDGSSASMVFVDFVDQGTGINKKDLANIFQPFFTTKTEGTGLGLATCKRIVEAHRGHIYVESTPGQGTKMSVALPTTLGEDR